MMFPAKFYDVPNQEPVVKIRLDRVSVYNQKIELPFRDDLLGDVKILFEVKVSVALHAMQRGIHMSRIEQAFQNLPVGCSLGEVSLELARRVVDLQKQERATIELRGEALVRLKTNVTGLDSYNKVTILSRATAGPIEEVSVGLRATTMSACPCMQTYALEELARVFALQIDDPQRVIREVPIATHSQKGSVQVIVSGRMPEMAGVSLAKIYTVCGRATHLTSELLKRPDEYDMVRRTHMRAQFVEDVVRDVVVEMASEFGSEFNGVTLEVEAESYESIHGHDIQAQISVGMAELRSTLVGS